MNSSATVVAFVGGTAMNTWVMTVTGLLQQVLLTLLASTAGVMAVMLLGLKGGPSMTSDVSLYQFFGYCGLVVCSVLSLRVLAVIFRR